MTDKIEIPEEWEIQIIKNFVKIIDTPHYTSKTTDSGVPVIRTSDCLPSGQIDYSNTLFTSLEEYKKRSKVINPETGDILFTREAPHGIAVLVDKKEISIGQRIILVKTDSTQFYNPYIVLFLNSILGKNQSNSFAIKTTVERVNIDDIKKFQIPMPKLSEQKQISLIFSNISFEFVTTAPPSPVVRTLFPQKLKIDASAFDPTLRPLIVEPNASAASSINTTPFSLASASENTRKSVFAARSEISCNSRPNLVSGRSIPKRSMASLYGITGMSPISILSTCLKSV